jgi:hypothetical protein
VVCRRRRTLVAGNGDIRDAAEALRKRHRWRN